MGNGQGKPSDLSGETNLSHFRLLRVVGRGAFGKVRIVERKDTGLTFALKYIRKDEVVKSESVRNIIRERRILENVNHPFICNLRYSFQDIEYMYLVVDLMSGGDLRFHISRKAFTEEAVRFWIAELGCALRYIHAQRIVHRDIKPDNVLLDADGHVHLTDFNVASDILPTKYLTSKSGTLAYLAPEVYAGKGYDVRADWWSLGVVFFECIYNKRPFDGGNESMLSQQIQFTKAKLPVTQPPVNQACQNAIRGALDPNPNTRMGATWDSFIYNEFFRAIDFELLEAKQIEPIFVPSSEKTNFDATYDLEELLLEEAPLEARARRQKPRERLKEDASSQEIREDELHKMIEADFASFDYTVAAYKMITEAQGLSGEHPCKNTVSGGALEALAAQHYLTRSPTQQSSKSRSVPTSPSEVSMPQGHQGQFHHARLPPVGKRGVGPANGLHVTLDGTASWSELARQDATLPKDANTLAVPKSEHSGGVFGFLKGKRGRNHSPKPKERGVLGKEGARAVVS